MVFIRTQITRMCFHKSQINTDFNRFWILSLSYLIGFINLLQLNGYSPFNMRMRIVVFQHKIVELKRENIFLIRIHF